MEYHKDPSWDLCLFLVLINDLPKCNDFYFKYTLFAQIVFFFKLGQGAYFSNREFRIDSRESMNNKKQNHDKSFQNPFHCIYLSKIN